MAGKSVFHLPCKLIAVHNLRNKMINFSVDQRSGFAVVSFAFDGNLAPSDIQNLSLPDVALDQGIVISGRGPIWLFLAIAHHFHPAQWVASHDPRLGGAVICQSHIPGVSPGDLFPFS
jgi:CRISPR-associated protein Csx3